MASSSHMRGAEGRRPSTQAAAAEPSKAREVADAEAPVETSSYEGTSKEQQRAGGGSFRRRRVGTGIGGGRGLCACVSEREAIFFFRGVREKLIGT